jgi:dihydroorotate dehydrogenase electron transfer subunit
MFEAIVTSNKQIGHRFYRLNLTFSNDGAKAFADFKPGQFLEIDVTNISLPAPENIPADLLDASSRNILLRRPFSCTDVTIHGDKTAADILYCVLGPATLRMTTIKAEDSLSIIGPLGNGFTVPENKKYALLVSGGMGIPPLQHLGKSLSLNHPEIITTAFVGAKSKADLPLEGRLDEISQQLGFSVPVFAGYGIESMIATDNGSVGYKGFVTDCLVQWLEENSVAGEEIIIYCCGPENMLKKVSQIARDKNIDCQISMERRMACGIGLCQSCAIECKVPDSDQSIYKMCCQDGPVFDSREVVF